ncbi:MAG: AbrB/MazE/SpoVT family DNA-binding domain-containing protein [Nanoarchaeota archaeon]
MIVEISKGRQITIPAEIRSEFDLDTGSKLEIEKINNKIILKPIGNDLNNLFEQAKKIKPKHKLSAKQMDDLNERLFK